MTFSSYAITGKSAVFTALGTVTLSLLVGFAWADHIVKPQTNKTGVKKSTKPVVSAAAPFRFSKVDYNRDVRPILSEKCFKCHGADPKAIQGGLRLDTKEGAYKTLASGRIAIVAGNPRLSEILERIDAANSPLLMPPAISHKTLNAEEKLTLKRWISQGAEYKPHWAFVKPVRPSLPAVKMTSWSRNGIDRFLLSRLEQEGLKPSPEADKATLLRRVTLDLTGLPPTMQEQKDFTADKSPKAYEKVVDRLLASPRYGERMAQAWMDDARYADSNGYQADWERYQWRWRDWVIDAYNNNMPFDQFTIEQIAGDMLPNSTQSQKIATGFNRNHRINTEGGVIPEEWRLETVIDRVETTSAVWLGLTMGCARCHDHKYDPLSQKEFYQVASYFNNVPETGSGEERAVNHPPFIRAPTTEQDQKLAAADAGLAKLNTWLTARVAVNTPASEGWKTASSPAEDAALLKGIVARYKLSATPVVVGGSAPLPTLVGKVTADAGRSTGAVVTDGSDHVDLGNIGDFDTKEAFAYGGWINPNTGGGAPITKMDAGNSFRGWDIYLSGGRVATHIVNKWPENALKVTSKQTIPNGQWSHIFVTYDGTAKPDGVKLYINGKAADVDVEMNTLTGTIRTPVTAKIGTRTGADGFAGKVDDVVLYNRAPAASEIALLAGGDPAKILLAVAPDKRTPDQKLEIAKLWSERNDPEYKKQAAERDATTKTRADIDGQITTVMIMEEMPKPREAFILVRGQYDKHGEKVTANLPAAFGSLPKNAPNNRLGLAEWIASPDNPLTARVAVNRFWEKFFGIGLVPTTEDFGTRAEFPSNPELLDWLATEFVREKWDQKAIQKLIVTSAAYRQSSKLTPALLERDPENRLLARGPRFRLQAEMIHDQALAVSGLLVEKIGGPSVRPYQPDGIWNEISSYGNLTNYMHDKGDNLYRRSLYTIWKRTAAPPVLTLFDVPGREMCRVRRSRTNTPLQALVLMNEVTFVEAARVLAERMMTEGGTTPEKRIAYAFQRTLNRMPTPAESKILATGQRKLLVRYRAASAEAEKLISIGDAPRNPKLEAADLAACTMTASILLNMDETITKE